MSVIVYAIISFVFFSSHNYEVVDIFYSGVHIMGIIVYIVVIIIIIIHLVCRKMHFLYQIFMATFKCIERK